MTWQNWAGTASADPARRSWPRSTEEIGLAITAAGKDGLTVRALGSGHSFTPAAATSGVALDGPVECAVQVRAHGGITDGVAGLRDGQLSVELRAPLRGVAPGQTMVLYRPDPDGDEVIASATITR